MVDNLSDSLHASGYKAIGLHGDLKQNQRNAVMRDFKSGRSKILIATDVAARGIDVDDVEAVFNYDVPQELEYYVHRIGRTGRAGREGASYTLVSGRLQLKQLREIERYIDSRIEEKKIPTKERILKSQETLYRNTLIEALQTGANPEWLAFVESLTDQGYTATELAAVLCEKSQKKNKRLSSLKNIESHVAPRKTFTDRSIKDNRRGKNNTKRRSGSRSRDNYQSDNAGSSNNKYRRKTNAASGKNGRQNYSIGK